MKKRKGKKKFIIIALILIALIGLFFYISISARMAVDTLLADYIIETPVEMGSIEVKITGNGVIGPLKRYEIPASMNGEIKSVSVSSQSITAIYTQTMTHHS